MKNALFWHITPCGSIKNRRFRGTYRLHHQQRSSLLRLLVTANVVRNPPILVILMMEVIRSSETSILTRGRWSHISVDGIFLDQIFFSFYCLIMSILSEPFFMCRRNRLWRMPSPEILRRVAFVRADVSEERSASIISLTINGERGIMLPVNVRPFLQEPHGVTSQKTTFFIVTAVETSNLTEPSVVFRIHLAICMPSASAGDTNSVDCV
jgi:hypothetical protein